MLTSESNKQISKTEPETSGSRRRGKPGNEFNVQSHEEKTCAEQVGSALFQSNRYDSCFCIR